MKQKHLTEMIKYKREHYPKYPIYIISKGRYEYNITAKTLDKMGIDYRMAVEPQEYDLYAESFGGDDSRLLELPFSNHGKGSGPARNWCWDHSINEGHERHWLMDDNIYEFYRFNNNIRSRCESGSIFRAMEDFVDRYTNVALAGPQYKFFIPHDEDFPQVALNKRLMSCILIKNDLPFRWRAKYNEDVDLSIRCWKNGYTTMLFYIFAQQKGRTQSLKGGNTEELYGVGTYDKSKMLALLHPDCVEVVQRYGRWHHKLDSRPFQNIMPELKSSISSDMILTNDEYGIILVDGYGTNNMHKINMDDHKR